MKNSSLRLVGVVSLLAIGFAQEPAQELDPVVVEANRIPSDPSRTGASLTVLTSKDLAAFGDRPLGETLRSIPGIHFARSGPRGSLNTFSIRGSTQKYMLIRVDGINISDPASSQVEPLVQHILTSDIERIEVLRGSQSSLYGGQAVAGVIEITTKQAAGKGTSVQAKAEGGSFDTIQGSLSASHNGDRGTLRASVEHLDSKGFSAADETAGATEDDGYENTTVTLRGTLDLTPQVTLRGLVRRSEFTNEFDGFTFGVGPTDAEGEETEGEHTQAMAGVTATRMDGRQVHDLQVSYFEMDRETRGSFPSTFLGDRMELDYVGNQEVSDVLVLLFGANGYEEAVDNGSGLKEDSTIYGGFLQAEIEPTEQLFLSATGRVDDHSEFGREATWRSTAAIKLTDASRLRGSVGTGFRAPSLFELFDATYGNPDLDPETSFSWDAGVDHAWAEDRWKVSVSYFDLTLEDKIDFLFPAGFTTVEGESQSNGIEASLTGQLCEAVSFTASYTWIEESVDADGDPLLRVPEHDLALMLVYSHENWTASTTATYISGVQDLDYSGAAPTSELPSYWVLNGFVSWQLSSQIKVHVRAENLLDEDYQEVRGYGTAERSFYAGLSVDL
jgi:vitamin B12 transporter